MTLHPHTRFVLPDELNATDTWEIVWPALAELVKSAPRQPVQPQQLLKAADRVAAAFFRRSPDHYILVSSLSVEGLPAADILVRNCVVSSLGKRGTEFPLPAVLSSGGHRDIFAKHLDSSRYQPVKVQTKGRSIHEAAENALNALSLLLEPLSADELVPWRRDLACPRRLVAAVFRRSSVLPGYGRGLPNGVA